MTTKPDIIVCFDDGSYLEHYGVPGMKWGVRKAKEVKNKIKNVRSKLKDAKKAKEAKTSKSSDRSVVDEILKKKPSSMSNDEMNTAINRMLKERQIMDLSRKPPSALSKFLKSATMKMGIVTATTLGAMAIDRYMDKYKNDDSRQGKDIKIFLKTLEKQLKLKGGK